MNNLERLEKMGYNQAQINQIAKAWENDIRLEKCIGPEASLTDIRNIRKILELYKSDKKALDILYNAISKKIDISSLNDPFCRMNADTLKVYIYGLDMEYILEKFKYQSFNKSQAKEVMKGLGKGIDPTPFYNDKYSPREINYIVKSMNPLKMPRKYDVETLLKDGYKIQSIMILKKYPEIIPYTNTNISPEMVIAYKELFDYLKKENKLDKFFTFTKGLKSPNQLKVVIQAMKSKLDYTQLLSYNFNAHKLSVMLKGLKDGIDINVYKNNEYTSEQMDMIRILQTRIEQKETYKNCDIRIITNLELPAKEMKRKIDLYDMFAYYKNLDINKIFFNNSIKEIEDMLKKFIDSDTKYISKIYKEYKIEENDMER